MRGLASVYAPKGTIIGFATSPGEFASVGSGRNGTYTEALLQHIETPDTSIESGSCPRVSAPVVEALVLDRLARLNSRSER